MAEPAFRDFVVVVTGASTGLGRAIAVEPFAGPISRLAVAVVNSH